MIWRRLPDLASRDWLPGHEEKPVQTRAKTCTTADWFPHQGRPSDLGLVRAEPSAHAEMSE